MSSSEIVVKGEAIESDDDSDVEFPMTQSNKSLEETPSVEFHGTVFTGEAPESDDETYAFSNVKLNSAHEVTEVYQPSPVKIIDRPQTLLQRMLVERNALLWHHINQCVQSTAVTASSQIIASEQLLIKSQMKLQAASRLIKQANETVDHIVAKCNDILTADFLPDIKIQMKGN